MHGGTHPTSELILLAHQVAAVLRKPHPSVRETHAITLHRCNFIKDSQRCYCCYTIIRAVPHLYTHFYSQSKSWLEFQVVSFQFAQPGHETCKCAHVRKISRCFLCVLMMNVRSYCARGQFQNCPLCAFAFNAIGITTVSPRWPPTALLAGRQFWCKWQQVRR